MQSNFEPRSTFIGAYVDALIRDDTVTEKDMPTYAYILRKIMEMPLTDKMVCEIPFNDIRDGRLLSEDASSEDVISFLDHVSERLFNLQISDFSEDLHVLARLVPSTYISKKDQIYGIQLSPFFISGHVHMTKDYCSMLESILMTLDIYLMKHNVGAGIPSGPDLDTTLAKALIDYKTTIHSLIAERLHQAQ